MRCGSRALRGRACAARSGHRPSDAAPCSKPAERAAAGRREWGVHDRAQNDEHRDPCSLPSRSAQIRLGTRGARSRHCRAGCAAENRLGQLPVPAAPSPQRRGDHLLAGLPANSGWTPRSWASSRMSTRRWWPRSAQRTARWQATRARGLKTRRQLLGRRLPNFARPLTTTSHTRSATSNRSSSIVSARRSSRQRLGGPGGAQRQRRDLLQLARRRVGPGCQSRAASGGAGTSAGHGEDLRRA